MTAMHLKKALRAILPRESRSTPKLLPHSLNRPLSRRYYGHDMAGDQFSWQAGRLHALLFWLPAPVARVAVAPVVRRLRDASDNDDRRHAVELLAAVLHGGYQRPGAWPGTSQLTTIRHRP